LRATVSIISAFAVFVHAAVGCCAHHAHADGAPAGCPGHHVSWDGTDHAGHEHGHAETDCGDQNWGAEHGEESDQQGPSRGDCDGERCLGIRVAKAEAVNSAGGLWVKLDFSLQIDLRGDGAVQAAWLQGDSFAPPVRRHLAHCVLLI
jgi:hypothetical protein